MSLFTAWTTPKIYTLSLHDALPISAVATLRRDPRARTPRARSRYGRAQWLHPPRPVPRPDAPSREDHPVRPLGDRKSTRLNSSHTVISYAVFCLKKKKDSTTFPGTG